MASNLNDHQSKQVARLNRQLAHLPPGTELNGVKKKIVLVKKKAKEKR